MLDSFSCAVMFCRPDGFAFIQEPHGLSPLLGSVQCPAIGFLPALSRGCASLCSDFLRTEQGAGKDSGLACEHLRLVNAQGAPIHLMAAHLPLSFQAASLRPLRWFSSLGEALIDEGVSFNILNFALGALWQEKISPVGRRHSFEIAALLDLRLVKNSLYFNQWHEEACGFFDSLGLEFSMDAEGQPLLSLRGKCPASADQIIKVRQLLMDIGKHLMGCFWVSESLDGAETIRDYAAERPKSI